jgi:hypothetical protein
MMWTSNSWIYDATPTGSTMFWDLYHYMAFYCGHLSWKRIFERGMLHLSAGWKMIYS